MHKLVGYKDRFQRTRSLYPTFECMHISKFHFLSILLYDHYCFKTYFSISITQLTILTDCKNWLSRWYINTQISMNWHSHTRRYCKVSGLNTKSSFLVVGWSALNIYQNGRSGWFGDICVFYLVKKDKLSPEIGYKRQGMIAWSYNKSGFLMM